MMSLWCLFRSPLMMGGDLARSPEASLELLTHSGLLTVHRDGRNPRPLYREGTNRAWISDAPDGGTYLGLFNLGEEDVSMDVGMLAGRLGTSKNFDCGVRIRDMHADRELFGGAAPLPSLKIPRHGSRLLSVSSR